MEECIVINRISSQRQDEGYSLPQQSKMNLEYAGREGRNVIKEFNIIESAKASEKRDDFNNVVVYLKKHPSIDYVYIEKTDRLTRNLKDAVLAYDLVNNHGITFVFTRDNFVLNQNSNSHAKFQFDIKAVLAKNYIDNLSDEVKKGQRGMLEEGKWPGGASPTGYIKVNKLLVPDEPRASLVIKMFKLYADGSHSLKSLKKIMDDEGFRSVKGKVLSKSNYFSMLNNPIYYGMLIWNGKIYKGIQQPLIDKQLFDRVQAMLHRTKNGELIPVYAKHEFIYRGLMQCGECKCKITAEIKNKTNKGNGKVHTWIYYHCTHFKPCSQVGSVREEKIDEQIVNLFKKFNIGEETTKWLKNKLKESHASEIEYRKKAINHLNLRHYQISNRLDQLYDDKLDNIIDNTTYARKRETYLKEQSDILEQIKRHTVADEKYVDFGCRVLDIANRASEIYKVRNPEEKRYILNLIFSHLLLKDKNVQFSLKSIFKALLDYQKTKDWLPD